MEQNQKTQITLILKPIKRGKVSRAFPIPLNEFKKYGLRDDREYKITIEEIETKPISYWAGKFPNIKKIEKEIKEERRAEEERE